MKKNITRPSKGLHTDNSPQDQPKDTYRFALNAVNETELGDLFFNSNEESNEECAELPNGYIPIGKVYVGNGETVIFSVAGDGSSSEIGVRDSECNYTTHVNTDLNFKVTHQIDSTFRLRRGCERTIYWVDGNNNKPRYYNLDKPDSFKTNGNWDANKFNLIRSYSNIPEFDDVEVLDSGGQLEPGSYNIAIQYLDENFNPTEWITTSNIINIYNDDTTDPFLDIRGSINHTDDFRDFPTTTKAIKVLFNNLDTSFAFYRLAFIEANNGSGLVSAIRYTNSIPTTKKDFIYTGINFETTGSEEEILFVNNIIDSADSIEQVENRLLLANVQGKQVNFCRLQRYASKIQADVITKKVIQNVISEANTKSPTVHFEGVGYMPGEIYSFGIVYVFADGSLSPVYHIPGKSPNVATNKVFKPGTNVYPMAKDNVSQNTLYTDNNSCDNGKYWGDDSEGDDLTNEFVRHHRFPLRNDIGVPLVKEESTTNSQTNFFQVKLVGSGTINTPCTQDDIDDGECTTLLAAPPFQVQVEYTVDGVTETLVVNINPALYTNSSNSFSLNISELSQLHTSNNITIVKIEETKDDGSIEDVTSGSASTHGMSYTATIESASVTIQGKIYSAEIYGIQFSNIDLPPTSITNGEQVVGYYIVRNERTEEEKTILDSAIMTPSVLNSKYVSHGLLCPEFLPGNTGPSLMNKYKEDKRISKKVFGLIHPEHKFYDKKYTEYSEIIQEGVFDIVDRKRSKSRYLDVMDGTSYDPDIHRDKYEDKDGWSLKAITRDNISKFRLGNWFNITSSDIDETFYLDALESKNVDNDTKTVYNIAGDNKVGMINMNTNLNNSFLNKLAYVYLKRNNADPYSTYRTLPYIKASINVEDTQTTAVFSGDTYISPMRYVNTVFWDNRIAERAIKRSIWQIVAGILLIATGAVLSFFTAGASTLLIAAGITIIGGGALLAASGIKKETWTKAYQDEYDKGLRETSLDMWVNSEYKYGNYSQATTPEDDEIQWIGECVTDLWFESQVNSSIRYKMTSDVPTFLDAPGVIENGRAGLESTGMANVILSSASDVYYVSDHQLNPFTKLDKHIMAKLAAFNSERNGNHSYVGHPLGEWYKINPDYNRINNNKLYYHLGIEYDCCSECQEDFPHRVHYSEQSFQEELTDNFRVFLPNNYRDIEGETGKVTDLFRIKNNLYIHTEEALWHLPQNFQERITNDIVSFIGTGEYFNIPPRKILDENQSSGGCKHKWATLKTKYGVFFVSEKEKKIYQFDGNSLKAISEIGNSNWFKENGGIQFLQDYYRLNGVQYPYDNNPSNIFGVGYIAVYDTKKERIIFTKKDNLYKDEVFEEDSEICVLNGVMYIFRNISTIIANEEANGWTYLGIEDCKMKFSKYTSNAPFGCISISGSTSYVTSVNGVSGNWYLRYLKCGETTPTEHSGHIGANDRFDFDIGPGCIQSGSFDLSNQQNIIVTSHINRDGNNCAGEETLEFKYIDGEVIEDPIEYNNSWTLSFSLKGNHWVSFHSYMPNFYYYIPEKFYSWQQGSDNFWKHNKIGEYQNFYGERKPYIIEYVAMSEPLQTKIWDDLMIHTEAKKYNSSMKEYVDERFVTFNKAIMYNTRQCTGELLLKVKDTDSNSDDYMLQQVVNLSPGTIIVDRNERNWTLNDIRDIRVDYSQPIFDSDIASLQPEYFIDKTLNTVSLDVNKDWTQMESLRDKYLCVRLIFDNFEDVKLLMNYSIETENESFR